MTFCTRFLTASPTHSIKNMSVFYFFFSILLLLFVKNTRVFSSEFTTPITQSRAGHEGRDVRRAICNTRKSVEIPTDIKTTSHSYKTYEFFVNDYRS